MNKIKGVFEQSLSSLRQTVQEAYWPMKMVSIKKKKKERHQNPKTLNPHKNFSLWRNWCCSTEGTDLFYQQVGSQPFFRPNLNVILNFPPVFHQLPGRGTHHDGTATACIYANSACVTVSDDFIIPSIELFALVAPGKIEFKLEFGFLSTIEDSWKFCDAELKLKIVLYAKDSLRVRLLVLKCGRKRAIYLFSEKSPKSKKE